jgi:hypothetical protein
MVESMTAVPVGAIGDSKHSPIDLAGLDRCFGSRVAASIPLLLHLGHKGLGRILAELSGRDFIGATSPLTRQRLGTLRIGHRALVAVGLFVDAWQLGKAIERSVLAKSARPATAQAARSLTTWGAVWAGVELFGSGGAVLGIELGPGVVVVSAVGAAVGGCVGFFAGDWLARQIETVRVVPGALAP